MNDFLKDELSNFNTLFLDRDGTINNRLVDDYVKTIEEFEFLPGVLEALYRAEKLFQNIIVVTNQQGVGKGIMLIEELKEIHDHMIAKIELNRGRIDQIYTCTDLAIFNPLCRKPNPGMALQAKQEFPDIEFDRSIMIGDTQSDMEFGKRLGMYTVLINDKYNQHVKTDLRVDSLLTFINTLL